MRRPRSALGLGLALALGLGGSASAAEAPPRPLSLADAVELAMRVDPVLAESQVQKDRSKLGVLRAQLERVSLKIDGTLQELWNIQNVGGPTIPPYCTLGLPDQSTCTLAGGTWVANPDQNPSSGQGLFNLQANLVAPIFTGFRITADVKRAQLTDSAALSQVRQSRKDTAIAVARAYWQVRRVQLMAQVADASLERMREAEKVAEGRVNAGLAPPIDANRARLRRIQQEALLADLAGQARESLAQLAVALQVQGGLQLTDDLHLPDGVPPPVDELLAQARAGRPELQIARFQLEGQHQVVRAQMAGYYPQLSAFGSFQYGNNPFQFSTGASVASSAANPFTGLAGNLTLGAVLRMNFFDTLSTWSSVKDAKFEESRLAEEKKRADRIVESDVRSAHARVEHLTGRRAPLLAALDVARDNATLLEKRYQNGDALVIEYLDAQIDLAQVELTLVDVSAQLELAWLELDAALGRTVGAR